MGSWNIAVSAHPPQPKIRAPSFTENPLRKTVDGDCVIERVPQEEWEVLIREKHAGYIYWEEYERNQRHLRDNCQSYGADRRKSPPREGPALLQGLLLCGCCGKRMTVRYHSRRGQLSPDYVCQREGIEHAEPICQHIPGSNIDEAVGNLLVEAVTPVTLEVALAVQQELQSRLEEGDRLRQQQVERSRYEAELARRRYLRVDPDNRLVADSLEADWNAKLKMLTEAQELCERQREQDRKAVNDQQQAAILSLASSFPQLWRDPAIPDRERKRIVRLLLEDVTLIRGGHYAAPPFQGRRLPRPALAPPVVGTAQASEGSCRGDRPTARPSYLP